jgi:hypothetical protein
MSEPTLAPTAPPRPRGSARLIWAERLARFPNSGLGPAQFCAHEGVSLASFYAWRRRLQADVPPAADQARPGPRLLPVRLPMADPAVEIVLPQGPVVRLRPGCDLAFVHALIQTLGGPPC